jgi:feruloyl-CoA synthase
LLAEPLNVDAGEITDKGYINQRAVLERRAGEVVLLYAGGPGVMLMKYDKPSLVKLWGELPRFAMGI